MAALILPLMAVERWGVHEITLQGPGRELLQRPEIRAAYLEGATR